MRYDLVLAKANVVTSHDTFCADIGVKDGKIQAIAAPKSLRAKEVLDVTGLQVLPGIIDSHVHLRYPGRPDREDVETGTQAACAGGITTIFEMPISEPSVSTGEILTKRAELMAQDAYVDFALYGGAGSDNMSDIAGLMQAGAIGYKTFLHAAPAGRESEFRGICCTDEGLLLEVLKSVAKTGLVGAIHVESNSICERLTHTLREAGRTIPIAHAESRPEIAEIASAASVIVMAEETGARIQLCHMSTDRGVKMAHDAKKRGVPITVETCPHYLAADVSDLERLGAFARINPPLRSRQTVEALWTCMNSGMIDMIGSDHAPYTYEEKAAAKDDIFVAPCGSPGLETMLPVMLNEVSSGRTDLNTLVRLMSENPARVFGLYPTKGSITVGAAADFTIVDMGARKSVRRDKMRTKAKDAALLFEDRSLTGWPVITVVAGQVVMREGQITAAPGVGRFVSPAPVGSWR